MKRRKSGSGEASGSALGRMREICLALPDTALTITWGEPHFRVAGKIFASYGEKDGRIEIGFKLEKEHAARLVVTDPRFRPAPYVGKHGWVSMDASKVDDWNLVRSLVRESYELIAPARSRSKASGTARDLRPRSRATVRSRASR